MRLKKKYYHIKNSIKYFFKRNLNTSELYRCSILTEGGYMSKNTYKKIIKKECGEMNDLSEQYKVKED